MSTEAEIFQRLARGGSATTSTIMTGKGVRKHFMNGPKPVVGEGVYVGRAFTISYLPAREDVTTKDTYRDDHSIMAALELVPEGAMVIIDCHGDKVSGTVGEMLLTYIRRKKVAGLITDGSVRDIAGLRRAGLPIWATAVGAPEAIYGLHYQGYQATVGCGGVRVVPGDIVVADEDGVVVVPDAMAEQISLEVEEKCNYEVFVLAKISEGRGVKGLYPASDATQREYDAWKKTA